MDHVPFYRLDLGAPLSTSLTNHRKMFALRRHSYLSKASVFRQTISEVEKGTKSILSFLTAAITAMVCTFHTYQDGRLP